MSDTANQPEERVSAEVSIDPAVTRKLFLEWRSPRFGSANPKRMNNPVWEWLVKSGISAYGATQRLKGPSAMDAGPGWCFVRFGQSSTPLPDGRVVLIAGEHEDSYDPDFYIYNDVVVRHPDGRIDIFGYPRTVFPPTDSHSATLVSNRIVMIGNLGYPEERHPGKSPVRILDLETFAITEMQTSGTPPGWVHGHKVTLSEDGSSILLSGGKLERGGKEGTLVENIDDWRLHLSDWRWERLTERRWLRWEVRRQDGEMNHLFAFRQAVMTKQIAGFAKANKELAKLQKSLGIPSLEEELGRPPDLDLFAKRYRPPLDHEVLPQPIEEFDVHRIKVGGIIVRYVEDMHSVQLTVEGDLPQETVADLKRDLVDKLSMLENAPFELIKL